MPRHNRRDQQEHDRWERASADDEQMSRNRAGHRRREQRRANTHCTGNQQQDRADHFEASGEVPEPLAESDLLERGDVHLRAGQFRRASQQKRRRRQRLQNPERDVQSLRWLRY